MEIKSCRLKNSVIFKTIFKVIIFNNRFNKRKRELLKMLKLV